MVTVHIDRIGNAFGEIFLFWGRQFDDEEVQEDRELLPFLHAVRQNRREKMVGMGECLGLAFKNHLLISAEIVHTHGDAAIKLIGICFFEAKTNKANLPLLAPSKSK